MTGGRPETAGQCRERPRGQWGAGRPVPPAYLAVERWSSGAVERWGAASGGATAVGALVAGLSLYAQVLGLDPPGAASGEHVR